MNRMIKLSAIAFASIAILGNAYAATPGGYIGIGLGASKQNIPSPRDTANDLVTKGGATYAVTTNSPGGLGGNIFGGYNFNEYFGLEARFMKFADATNKLTANNADSAQAYKYNISGTDKYSLNALSLVGKVYLPINQQFNLYVLGGVARVNSSLKSTAKITKSFGGVSQTSTESFSRSAHKTRPTYGIGASYSFTQHISTSVEFSQISGSGNMRTDKNATPTASLLSLNLAYNF